MIPYEYFQGEWHTVIIACLLAQPDRSYQNEEREEFLIKPVLMLTRTGCSPADDIRSYISSEKKRKGVLFVSPVSLNADRINMENSNYIHSHSDICLAMANEEAANRYGPPRMSSVAVVSLPATYGLPGTGSNLPSERQLSLLDPMSDRVSTILVWQNLTVTTREKKRTEFLRRIRAGRDYVPNRKCLLNNVSGAITGGLWAVMGKLARCRSQRIVHLVRLIL